MAELSASETRVVSELEEGGLESGSRDGGRAVATGSVGEGGFFGVYKPEQGKWTRGGTFVGALLLILWGGIFIYRKLDVFEGDQWWQLSIIYGVPILFVTSLAALAWWVSYSRPPSGDFLIATEGEMKKVSWSSRREVIGSTKVVIIIMFMMAAFLFLVDTIFVYLFKLLGILRLGGT